MSAAAAARPTKANTASPRAQALARHTSRQRYLRPTKAFLRSGEPDDNYTPRIPHTFWRLYGEEKVSGAIQLLAIGYIMARTWGDPGKPAAAAIALSDFARELGCSIKMAQSAIADLVARGMIAVCDPKGLTGDDMQGQQRLYRATPQNWAGARKYEPKAAGDDAAGDDAAGDDAAGDDAALKIYASQTVVVSHGKRCKAVPFHVAVKGTADPVRLRMETEVTDPDLPAISISATSRGGGLFRLAVCRAVLTKGEDTAKNHGSAVPWFTPDPSPAPASAEYSKFLKTQLLTNFHHPYDAAFLVDVLLRVKNAPIELYQAKLADRLERAKSSRTKLDHRILLWVADDVGKLMTQRVDLEREHLAAANAKAAARQVADDVAATAPMDAGLRESCRAHALADPKEYERWIAVRAALGETDWPTLEELGVSHGVVSRG